MAGFFYIRRINQRTLQIAHRKEGVYLVNVHVEHSEESVWIAFAAITFYGGAYQGLRQDEVREFIGVK